MTPYDHAGAVIVFEASHRVQTRFELPMVRFDSIVRVLLSVVERSRDQLIHYGERHPGPIGDHLDRFAMSACAIVKNRPRSFDIASSRDGDVDDLAVLVDRSVDVAPRPATFM